MSLTGAYSLACGLDIGGITSIHLTNKADITSMTLGSGLTSYDTITMETAKVFYQVDFETASWTKNDDNSTVLAVDLGKLSGDSRDFIQEIKDCGKCGVVAIVTDANAVQWVLGYDEKDLSNNPLIVESSTGSTASRGEDTENAINFVRLKPKLEEERIFTGTIPVV